MREIEKYIKQLCKDVYLDPKEVEEFKAEIRNHLSDTVKELQQQGNSEGKSIELALRRFGEEKQINVELRKVYKFQRKFKKSMMVVSMFTLVLSLIFFISYMFLEQRNFSDFDGMQFDFHNQIEKKILADQGITNEEIETIFHKYERILRHVYIIKTENNSLDTEYLYPTDTSRKDLDIQPYITYPINMENSNTRWEVQIALSRAALFSPVPNIVFIISIICFVTYWVLFGLWNTMNAYRTNRLNILWTILFFSLNIFAYFLFKLEYRIKIRKLESA